MKMTLPDILFSFSLFSVLGYLLEVLYRSARQGRLVNPGLLRGPYLILYGTGAVVLMQSVSLLHGYNLALKALAYLVITTGLELASAFIAQRLFKRRLWDYSDEPFNYRGHICLKFSFYWVLLAFAFEYLILPWYQGVAARLSGDARAIFAGMVVSAMLVDFMVVSARSFLDLKPKEKEVLDAQFLEKAAPLLKKPEVMKLAEYRHHRQKTRLDHVVEVAYLSFLWGRRLGLDCDAIVRGALLHDLFFYDWLREGPRLHGFRHHNIALRNARKIIRLSRKEEDIIRKHMWPLTVIPPRYAESMIVSLVDTYCCTMDYIPRNRSDRCLAVSTVRVNAGPEDRQV